MTWQRVFIDGRFQRVYVPPAAPLPAYVFGEQRKTCERCANHVSFLSTAGNTEDGCTRGGRVRSPCSWARLPDGHCGPEARGFKPKECA